MIKVYCDTSGYQPYLKNLKIDDVSIFGYPYENKNRRIKKFLAPSGLTWNQSDYTWGRCLFSWDDISVSKKFNSIETILNHTGQNTEVDVQHLDCAYKNCCHIFLTTDIVDIVNNRNFLEPLLNIKIFDAKNESDLFMNYFNHLLGQNKFKREQ